MTTTLQLNAEEIPIVAEAMEFRSTTPLPNRVMRALMVQWHDSQILTALDRGNIEATSLLRTNHRPAWSALQRLASGEEVSFAEPEIVDPDVGTLGFSSYCENLEIFLDNLRAYRANPNSRLRRSLVESVVAVDAFVWISINENNDSHATYDFCTRAETASSVYEESGHRPGMVEASGIALFAERLPTETLTRIMDFAEGRDPENWCADCETTFDLEGVCNCAYIVEDENNGMRILRKKEND